MAYDELRGMNGEIIRPIHGLYMQYIKKKIRNAAYCPMTGGGTSCVVQRRPSAELTQLQEVMMMLHHQFVMINSTALTRILAKCMMSESGSPMGRHCKNNTFNLPMVLHCTMCERRCGEQTTGGLLD